MLVRIHQIQSGQPGPLTQMGANLGHCYHVEMSPKPMKGTPLQLDGSKSQVAGPCASLAIDLSSLGHCLVYEWPLYLLQALLFGLLTLFPELFDSFPDFLWRGFHVLLGLKLFYFRDEIQVWVCSG